MARIMIVDDSSVMRKNLATILKQVGHEIVGEASNGKQAINLYFELHPDIVTMDISMPIMKGVDAVKQIIEGDPNAIIIMISALNQKKMIFDAINNGAKHYIIKPIDSVKVLSVVNEVLDQTENKELKKIDENIHPETGFEIDNIEGKFIIKFNESLGIKDHNLLSMAIRGLLFIKPLRVVCDFNDQNDVSNEILEPILRLSKEIRDIDGEVTFIANNNQLNEKIYIWELQQ